MQNAGYTVDDRGQLVVRFDVCWQESVLVCDIDYDVVVHALDYPDQPLVRLLELAPVLDAIVISKVIAEGHCLEEIVILTAQDLASSIPLANL